MHTERVVEPPDPNKKYEVRDIPINGIVKATTIFFAFVIIMGGVGKLALHWLGGNVDAPAESAYMNRRPLPAKAPILQDTAAKNADLYILRQKEEIRLNSNGNDPTTGKPFIPIDDAIKQEAAAHPQ